MNEFLNGDDLARIAHFKKCKEEYMSAMSAAWNPIRDRLDLLEEECGVSAAIEAAEGIELDFSFKLIYLSNKYKQQETETRGAFEGNGKDIT